MFSTGKKELGLGLIGIGRQWGHILGEPPDESEAISFLEAAVSIGITFFDTAPSYGSSEDRLGKFLNTLTQEQRRAMTIATKLGEFWDNKNGRPYTDHTYESLCNSIDVSIDRLGAVDILQLHKTNPDILRSNDLARVLEYARAKGISCFGASVSDNESARIVCMSNVFSFIQFPFNMVNTILEEMIDLGTVNGKTILINRPYNMGQLLHSGRQGFNKILAMTKAYEFILRKDFEGKVLTGTRSIKHLRENMVAWDAAVRALQ